MRGVTKKGKGTLEAFELANNIAEENIYKFDEDEYDKLLDTKPWEKAPAYYKKVKISAVALLKMVMHAVSGGKLEIMGVMQGKIIGDNFLVMDAFGLPVTGTETRVNPGAEANAFMVNHLELSQKVGRLENICGWYHSHPGYGCWLSGIDVTTQKLQQKHSEPYLAIVIDPNKTMATGKVEIGCFRTYPETYKPKAGAGWEDVPLDKLEDFGIHASHYYKLEHSFFKSKLDQELLEKLWNKYWVQTLSSHTLVGNREYLVSNLGDLARKLSNYKTKVGHDQYQKSKGKEDELDKITQQCVNIAVENSYSMTVELLKDVIFAQK